VHLLPGHRFKLTGHFDANGPYLLTRVEHTLRYTGNYRSGEDMAVEYANRFTAIPDALPFRPPQVTPKPVIPGAQTAVVVGPAGETLHCDKYGRVKVRFFWDRQSTKNENSSCWIRVGQVNAGKGFGSVDLPRVGHEVIVAFLEGDPDQPIIVGGVYNAENMPPYQLPEQRAYSGVKHRSHRGVARNAGEIRFQNQLGSELLLLHAETDSLQQAENNHLMQVGNVHRHEVGQFYHVVVGKPVNVNQAVAGIRSVVAGSGAGGGNTSKEESQVLSDNTEQDIYPTPGGLWTEVQGFSWTFIGLVNWTEIGVPAGLDLFTYSPSFKDLPRDVSQTNGVLDTYICHGSAHSTIDLNNTTEIGGNDHYSLDGTAYSEIQNDNHTEIHGDDYYNARNSHSEVSEEEFSISKVKTEISGSNTEVAAVHLEGAGIHVELNGMALETHGLTKSAKSPLKIFSLG
jgi:type VI secretion system secreted protein VgrG